MKKTGKFVELDLPAELGLKRRQTIRIPTDIFGSPIPFDAFDFDGTLFNGSRTYRLAAEELVMVHGGELSKLPSSDDFKMGVHPDLHGWGVPQRVPLDDAWDTFIRLIIKIEKRNPCRLFPGIPAQLRSVIERSHHPIIVTLNSIHEVPKIIQSEAGLEVEAIVVEDKRPVLEYLARWHRQHHGIEIPFHYFGDTKGDMLAASAANGLIYPVAVTRREILKNPISREAWCKGMRECGARAFVSHRRISDVLRGEHLKTSVLI